MADPIVPELSTLELAKRTQYIFLAMLSWISWDHMLTFTSDIRFFRKLRKFDPTAISFLMNRYCAEVGILFLISVRKTVSIGASPQACGWELIVVLSFVSVTLATENAAMTIRMYNLWGRRKAILTAICIALTITYSISAILMGFIMKEVYEHAFVVEGGLCVLVNIPKRMVGIWTAMLAYDLFMIFMFIMNVLEQPYRHSSEIFARFKRNGIVVYSILAADRLFNLLATILLPPYSVLAVSVSLWAVSTIAMSRLVIQVEYVQALAQTDYHSYEMGTRYAP